MQGRTARYALAALLAASVPVGEGGAQARRSEGKERHPEKTLYVWAGDQARQRPDFLAVIDFDEESPGYGRVLRTVPVPPPGNVGNEPHHCSLSADGDVLACGGLLSVLSGQPGIFFFDVSDARHPEFLFATSAPGSSITDDFLPLPEGGFLVTQMGSASGGAPGRLAEFDRNLRLVAEHPLVPPTDGFNPHGISADFGRNLMVTSDFLLPATTLNPWPGPIELRGALRFWDLQRRGIIRTVVLPDAAGSMDVKLIPGDPHGRAVTANMFSGLVYTVDPTDGSVVQSFDCEEIVPHVEVPVRGGMVQLLAMPRSGDRLLFDQDGFGKVHFEGDHRVHVIAVGKARLRVDPRFQLDFDTAFGFPARPHGMAAK